MPSYAAGALLGIVRSLMSRGHTGGRPLILTDDDIEAAKAMLANPDIPVTQIAQRLVSLRRRSIGILLLHELRIPRVFDNGCLTPKTGRSKKGFSPRLVAAMR